MVLFYSDNGTDQKVITHFKGQSINGGKATPLQTGIRMPLLAYWLGVIEAGCISADLVDASDFLPPLAALGA